MKTLLAMVLFTSACGTLFNDSTTDEQIVNPNGFTVTVDGLPVKGPRVSLDNRKDHTIIATDKDGKIVGSCEVTTHLQARYIVGDLLLGIVPLVVDAITGDWMQVEDHRCVL